MGRKIFVAGAGLVAAAAMAVVPVAAYAGASGATHPARAAAPHAAAAGSTHVEHFLIADTANNGNGKIIATGAFTAGGKDIEVNDNKDRMVFGDGSFVVRHPHAKSTFGFNPSTCVFHGTLKGKYRITNG